ncbi:unnamed protein product [Absidia cylindrospora]
MNSQDQTIFSPRTFGKMKHLIINKESTYSPPISRQEPQRHLGQTPTSAHFTQRLPYGYFFFNYHFLSSTLIIQAISPLYEKHSSTTSPTLTDASSTLLPTQTASPASSIDHPTSPFLNNNSPILSPFALFGTLPPLDHNDNNNNNNNNNNNDDLDDIMDDDDIFDAFGQLPSSTAPLSIQSPPLSPSLVPQDLDDMDDFLLF